MKRASFVSLALLCAAVISQSQPAAGQLQPAPAPATGSAVSPLGAALHKPIKRVAPDKAADRFDLGPVAPRPAEAPAAAGEYRDFRGKVGYLEVTAPGILGNPNWTTLDNGARVWAAELSVPGSPALRARLRGDWGHDGLELRVYDPVSGNAFGPYTRPTLDENGDWWTTIIFSDAIGLEFHQPATGEPDALPRLPELNGIAKHWSDQGGPEGGLECGHLDLMCSPAWIDEAEAVCSYSYMEAGDSWVCTGALLNRAPSDLSPLLLTADHCIDSQTNANTVSCVWFFQNDACDGSTPTDPDDFPRTDGALLLKTRNNSDVSLLGLFEPPVGNLWLGWDAGGWTLQSDAQGIHHPGGTFKRISFGDVTAALFVIYGQNDAHVWRVDWDSGSTEGGSSGSPVLDDNGVIRGQLKGGPDCGTGDYGRFSVSFETLEPYIFNMASPVYVQAGVGGAQLGTSGDPFNTVYEATFCVFAGDEVRIRSANYNESFRLWRPMRLNAENGVVRIGTP
jgi:hypothetical protein